VFLGSSQELKLYRCTYTLQGLSPAHRQYRLQHQHAAPLASHLFTAISTRTQNAPRLSHPPPAQPSENPDLETVCYWVSPPQMCIYYHDLTPTNSRKTTLLSHVLRKRKLKPWKGVWRILSCLHEKSEY